jgi:hypothetical protein
VYLLNVLLARICIDSWFFEILTCFKPAQIICVRDENVRKKIRDLTIVDKLNKCSVLSASIIISRNRPVPKSINPIRAYQCYMDGQGYIFA